MRVGCWQDGHMSMTLLELMGASISLMPAWGTFCVARACFLIILIPSTSTFFSLGNVRNIFPFLPLSFPERILTLSPLRTCSLVTGKRHTSSP
jgi:hypothetical protein